MHAYLASAKRQEKIKQFLGNLGLIGFMIGLYYHTFSFFTAFFDSWLIGHAVAIAVDASTYAALFRRREMTDSGEIGITAWTIFFLCFTTSLFTNFHESYMTNFNGDFTLSALMSLDVMQKVKLAVGALIPPLLMFLSLVMASGRTVSPPLPRRETIKQPAAPELSFPSTNGTGNGDGAIWKKGQAHITQNKEQRKAALREYLSEYPDASIDQMARAVGVSSRNTIRKYLQEINATNGHFSGN